VQLVNQSNASISGPFAVEIPRLTSMFVQLEGLEAANADNRKTGDGARWTLSPAGGANVLAPGGATERKKIVWRLPPDMRGKEFPTISFRIYVGNE
jgi:hypothetical protein